MWAFGHHTWRFAEHQYDYIGADNNNISSTNDGWIDLFGWGTSGWMSGAVCYQPWDTSKTNADYFPGGSNENDLTGGYAEADWAWHNAIQNVGSQHHLWRTLTRNEWEYLFYGRTDAALKYGGATVDTVRGVVILPDNWTLPAGLSFTPGVNGWLPYHNYDSSNSFSNNTHGTMIL